MKFLQCVQMSETKLLCTSENVLRISLDVVDNKTNVEIGFQNHTPLLILFSLCLDIEFGEEP